jgi:hypothetical protein
MSSKLSNSLMARIFFKIYKACVFALSPVSFLCDCDSLEELVSWGKINKIEAFNGQFVRAFILLKLFRYFKCSAFIETGTYLGQTAYFVRKVFHTVVFSCELNKRYYWASKISLFFLSGVYLSSRNSPDFLKRLGARSRKCLSNPVFYLDAHGYEYWPLADELNVISKYFTKGIIIVDDFFIPGNPKFDYDQYGGKRLSIDLVKRNFHKESSEFRIYYPVYNSDLEAHLCKRGMCIILFGQNKDLPACFPFDMLRKE